MLLQRYFKILCISYQHDQKKTTAGDLIFPAQQGSTLKNQGLHPVLLLLWISPGTKGATLQETKKHIIIGVSKNRGTPKWMVYNGKPYWNGWFGGTTIIGNIHRTRQTGKPENDRLKL